MGMQVVQPFWKRVWKLLTKLNMPLPHDPAIILFSPYPEELRTYIHTKTCPWMLITTYLIIVRTWRQTRGPLAEERKNKLWYVQTIECYSVLKSYQTEKTWRKLKCIFLSERSHCEKPVCCIMHVMFWKR